MKLTQLVPRFEYSRLDTLRLRTLINLRWYALSAVSMATFFARWLGFHGLAWRALVIFVTLGIVTNTLLSLLAESKRDLRFHRIYNLQVVLDIAALTGLLWASGGLSNPFSSLFVLHVVVAALIGTFGSVIAAGALASAAAILLHLLEQHGLLLGGWSPPSRWQDSVHLAALLVDAVAVSSVVATLSRRFQAKEARLVEAREALRLREQVLDRVLGGLSAAVEVVENNRVMWQNEAMVAIRELRVGEDWVCPGTRLGCNKALRPDTSCDIPNPQEPLSCLISLPTPEDIKVYRKYAWQVRSDSRVETVHLYVDETRQLAEEERLKLTERLASLGRMAQGIAHELNTPLSTVRTLTRDVASVIRAEEAIPGETRIDLEESLSLSLKELERCARITHGLLRGRNLANATPAQLQPLAPLVHDAVTLVSIGSRRSHQFSVDVDGVSAYVDPDALTQVLVNLLSNAVDAAPGGSTIEIGSRLVEGLVHLEIADRGEGITPAIRRRLFEPFATSKPVGQGTGLGLYMARMLLSEVGGTLELLDREGGGTTARVTLRQDAGEIAA